MYAIIVSLKAKLYHYNCNACTLIPHEHSLGGAWNLLIKVKLCIVGYSPISLTTGIFIFCYSKRPSVCHANVK